MSAQVLERVREMARAIAEFEKMELVHLEMNREGAGWILRIFIDSDRGVTLDDCSRVSRQLSAHLDAEDPIERSYTLEVSSPGLDRPLFSERDYERFAGRQVRISTFGPIDGRRNFSGRLLGLTDGAVHLALDNGSEIAIPRDQVAKARLEAVIEGFGESAGGRGRHE
jgi:ribosome maturation factor RimP